MIAKSVPKSDVDGLQRIVDELRKAHDENSGD